MKSICPNCEKETEIERIQRKEPITVRGEPIEVEVKYSRCLECGEEFENTRDYDALDLAYGEYRQRHGMQQPEQIREWRKAYDLTQREAGLLLGWGGATLSRYENGALQTDAHDKTLRLAMEPKNLLQLLKETPKAMSQEKRDWLMKRLTSVDDDLCLFERFYEQYIVHQGPDEYTGFRELSLTKLLNAILYLCRGGQLKTKINKLLFYADFKHFKGYTVSITGARYAHLPYGPAPDRYAQFLGALVDDRALGVEEVPYRDVAGEKYSSIKKPDLGVFEDTELKVLAEVKERFDKYTSSAISEFSHKEKGYEETENGEFISYAKYAKELQI